MILKTLTVTILAKYALLLYKQYEMKNIIKKNKFKNF